ncbi:hypothetical protein GWI33_011368, partial [Rhynchophorus ferrugineus]
GNGNCEQLCFSFPPEAVNDDSRVLSTIKCDCAVGRISDDGKKCESVEEFVVFSTRTEIRSISIFPEDTTLPFAPIGNLTNVVGIDFDYQNDVLLFTQIRPWARIAKMHATKPDANNIVNIKNKGIMQSFFLYR